MAYQAAGVGNRPPLLQLDRPVPVVAGKRRIIYIEEDIIVDRLPGDSIDEEYPVHRPLKRGRRESNTFDVHVYTQRAVTPPTLPEPDDDLPEFWSVPVARAALPAPAPVSGISMERTASGHSIADDSSEPHRSAYTELLEDAAAAERVRSHVAALQRRGNSDSRLHERVLRNIISPKSAAAAYPLDNAALESIFLAANELFFQGRLSQRVAWDWSHASMSAHYDSSVVGTTALRRAGSRQRGFETLIVLSSPILRDGRYSRRLLISTFLHELIHSYLFICCGFRARHCGGHTPGFHTIARLVDDWAGPDSMLYLSKMEADLSCFRAEETDVDVDSAGFELRQGVSAGERSADRRENGSLFTGPMGDRKDPEEYQHRYDHPQRRAGYFDGEDQELREPVPLRVTHLQQGYSNFREQEWPNDRAAHSAPPRARFRQEPYFDGDDRQEPRLPYV